MLPYAHSILWRLTFTSRGPKQDLDLILFENSRFPTSYTSKYGWFPTQGYVSYIAEILSIEWKVSSLM